jgi:broad specificity phosphatase PhoE/nicotinamide riboside kinase
MVLPQGQAFSGVFDAETAKILPSSEVTHVHLLRHGAVADLTARVVRGQMDVALSPRGRWQHHDLARWFARSEPRPERLFTSDLRRCLELASELGALLGHTPEVDARLREQSMGRWEGLTWEEITKADPPAVTAYWDDYYRARPSGGESVADLETRVVAWWRETFARERGRRIAIVTHIGAIRVLLCHFLGLDGAQALRFAPATASHTHVMLGEAGAVVSAIGERPWSFAAEPAHAIETAEARAITPMLRDQVRHPGTKGERAHLRPRIALSGSAGTGKTTLGKRLAAELGIVFIEERMRQRLERGFDLHGLTPAAWRALMDEDWSAQRAAEEDAAGGFVSDRSSLDFAAFWLHYALYEDERSTDAWMERMSADARSYDKILLLPWGSLPLEQDGVRSTNRWTQLRYQTILEGVLERFARPEAVVRVPDTDDFEQRVRFVLEALQR